MRILAAWMIVTIAQLSGAASAQTAPGLRPGSVRVAVYDETALPIAGAEVTLVAAGGSTASSGSSGPAYKAITNDRGEAVFDDVSPGTYAGRVESPGFDRFEIERFSLRAGARVSREAGMRIRWPDPFSAGEAQAAVPTSIIRAGPHLLMPFNRRYSEGIDQPIGKVGRLRSTFSHQAGHNIFRSRDANAPVDGVRPDPSIRNITELETSAHTRSKSLETDLSLTYPPRRFSANLNYVFGSAMGETDGAFSLPPDSFDLSGEWGPARNDVGRRMSAAVNSDLPRGFRVNANVRAQSAPPYNITTGTDSNGDGATNERPVGVRRNAGRGAATKTWISP